MGEIFNAWRTLLLVSLVSRVAPDRRVHSRIERNFLVAQGHQGRFPFRYSLFESTTSCRENFFTSSFRLERVSRWITPFVDVSGENNTDARYTRRRHFLFIMFLSILSHQYLTIRDNFFFPRGGVCSSWEEYLVQTFQVERINCSFILLSLQIFSITTYYKRSIIRKTHPFGQMIFSLGMQLVCIFILHGLSDEINHSFQL